MNLNSIRYGKHKYYAENESLINHTYNRKIWLLGVIYNNSKSLKIVVSYNRDSQTLSRFINKLIKTGKNIIADSLVWYNLLNSPHSGL